MPYNTCACRIYICASLSSASHLSAAKGVTTGVRLFGTVGCCVGGVPTESACVMPSAWVRLAAGTTIPGETIKVFFGVSKKASDLQG